MNAATASALGPNMTTQQDVWIIGGYQSDFARNFTKESLDISDLVKETATGTLAAAGISTAEVQVIHVANAMGELYVKQGHLGSMVASVVPELSGVPATRHEAACASGGVAVMAAMADLESGRYDVALVLGVEIERNVPGTVGAGHLASAAWVGHEGEGQDFVWPFTFSQIAEEYDRRYGLQDGHLRTIAAQNIANARTNPQGADSQLGDTCGVLQRRRQRQPSCRRAGSALRLQPGHRWRSGDRPGLGPMVA